MDVSRGLCGTNGAFSAYLQLRLLRYTWVDLTKYLIWPSLERHSSASGARPPFSFRVLGACLAISRL